MPKQLMASIEDWISRIIIIYHPKNIQYSKNIQSAGSAGEAKTLSSSLLLAARYRYEFGKEMWFVYIVYNMIPFLGIKSKAYFTS
jgi:hypothetical protein